MRLFFLVLLSFSSLCSIAQENDVSLAQEYFDSGEYDKAKNMFERLSKNNENLPYIYRSYLSTMLFFKEKEDAEKFIKKMIKVSGGELTYKLDHYILVLSMVGEDKSEKEFNNLVNELKLNEVLTEKTANFLIKNDLLKQTQTLLLSSRKALRSNSLYAVALANLYYRQGSVGLSIDELLAYLNNKPTELEQLKTVFQDLLKEDQELALLETKLYTAIQSDADNSAYNELLLWLNLQKKNFNKAFMQAKALDKRNRSQGTKLMEVGKIAMDNNDYTAASKFFDYVVKEFPSGVYYPIARKELLRAKEETIKNSFPIDKAQIYALLSDYKKLIADLGLSTTTLEARRNVALLHAFYLDQIDSAIVMLNEVVQLSRNDLRGKSLAKIDLGDLYLLKNEPWESTLLYSQVEKDMKEDVLGHDAKLRNAKLSYYKGDFELAQAHLDVLKLATSREISNDAIDLSILIQGNIGLDTSMEAMQRYAAIDLLLFQNKLSEALDETEQMLKVYPNHSLTDELLWLRSKMFIRIGNYEEALVCLEKITQSYSDDIWGDNALFAQAELYENKVQNKETAMAFYQKFLIRYPGSIFNAEARKRFRILRGDKL